jgi:poly-gamma-glutamate synthesis protein (capsule biosynthesis protein)
VLADIARLRESVDVAVVSLHWGEEFVGLPSESEVAAAHAMIEAGALAVIGHHPHVRRPCERIGQGVVAYSLGNFATDMLWQDSLRSGAILDCTWSEGLRVATLTPTVVDQEYRPVPGAPVACAPGGITGLPEESYRREIAATLRAQRGAAYRYAALRLHRYPPAVLGELAWTTAWNKLGAVRQALRGSGR